MVNKRFIDLSITIEEGLPSDPPIMIPEIDYMDHKAGAESMKTFFPGITEKDLPEGLGWAVEFSSFAHLHTLWDPPGCSLPLPSHHEPRSTGPHYR